MKILCNPKPHANVRCTVEAPTATTPADYIRAALVTGASGFIGRHLIRALLQQGRQVLALCRNRDSLRDLQHPLLRIARADLAESHSYLPYLNCETTVFHLAAVRSLPGTCPQEMHRVNDTATVELGRHAAKAKVVKFVYVSSAYIFGPSDGDCRSEKDGYCRAPTLYNAYIQCRVQALTQLKKLAEDRLNLVTVCPTIVFGPDHPSHPNRVTHYLRWLLRSRVEFVVEGGEQRRNLVYVGDVVRGILLAEKFKAAGEDFILAGTDVSPRVLNRMAMTLAGCSLRFSVSLPGSLALALAKLADTVRGYDRTAGYAAAVKVLTQEWRFSFKKSNSVLGYTPTSFSEAILKTLRFIQATGTSHGEISDSTVECND
ncbi:MAG: NAD-dependent epimerase/dehydratase family protein [Acidobacteria bacterium]|nr:NAD-dependent epimerase/dehydratase family protein [Acidobacteriota bacterium]